MKSSIEPGLVRIFQFFAAFQLVFLLLSAVSFTKNVAPKHPVAAFGLMLAFTSILFIYLLWPGLERHLGAAYLPLALGLNVIGVFSGEWLAGLIAPAQYLALSQEAVLFLFFPVLVVSWQYNFRTVALFLIMMGVLDFVLAYGAMGHTGVIESEYGRMAFARMAAFLAVGYIISRLIKEQRAQRQSLRQANAELTHYAATLEQLTISQERNRMARELHDTLAHTLSGIAVQLGAVESLWDTAPLEARAMLGRSLAATRSGLTETRRALQALRAAPLEDLGLAMALGALAEAAAGRAGLELDCQVLEILPKLSADVEQGLYRVAQEALENVVKHSAARQVRMQLTKSGSLLILTVADDGRGYQTDRVDSAHHFGLQGMRERAERMGGKLEIDSQPGRGTTVCLKVEVDRDPNLAV